MNLVRSTETFLSDNYLSHQRTRGIIKTNLLVQRGIKTALFAIDQQNENLFYEAQAQIEAAQTFLFTDVTAEETDKERFVDQITSLQKDLTQLRHSAMQGGLKSDQLEEIHARTESLFLELADADTKNWMQFVGKTAVKHSELRRIYYYFGLVSFILIAFTFLLWRSIGRRRFIERELQRTNTSLEQRIESRTEALKVSNAQLADKTRLLQSILETIPAPIFYKNLDGRYTGCNKAFEKFIGHSKDKIVGSTVYDIAPSDLAKTYHRADQELMDRGGTQVYESSVQYADGSLHEVIFNKAVITNPDGTASGLVGAMLDITDRKRAEEALSSIIESSPMGILLYTADQQGRIILSHANPAADDILGIRHDELFGLTMEQAFPALTATELPNIAMQICKEGGQWEIDAFPYSDKNIKGIFEVHAFQTLPGQMAILFADVTDKTRQQKLLLKAARGVTSQIGEDFFFSLARHLSEALGADYVLTGELGEDDPLQVDTIALWSQGGAIENMSCDPENTPCHDILNKGPCIYERDVRTLFPADSILRDLEVEAYIGIPLRRSDGSPLGVLAALFQKPLVKQEEAVSLLQIFGSRAAAEIERRQANRVLQESEERFRSMVQTIPDAVVLFHRENSRIVDVNEGFTTITGYTRDEAIGSDSLELGIWANPEDREHMYKLLDKNGRVDNLEIRTRKRNGDVVIGLLSVRVIQVGNEPHLLIVARDIDKTKKAQAALKKSERQYRELSQQFRALLDGISDALVLFSPQLEVVWANRGAAELFGYDHQELKGMPCKKFWTKSKDQCTECIQNCFSSGLPLEMIERTTDGRCWGIKLFPIKSADGLVENVIQIISDITEKTRLREQAAQASRLASLGELAAGVAHEINNPNAQIILDLPIVREAIEDSLAMLEERYREEGDFPWGGLEFSRMRREVPELISEMQDASTRIRNIVEDLKHFSRHERAEKMGTVDLNKAVATAARLTRTSVKRATSRFEVEYADHLPQVRGIEQRLEQVIVNLIINASQSLPERSCRISVRTCYDSENERCRVLVRDEGMGIDENILAHITDPFFTTRRETGGTGLGLSIATRIIKEHGGEMFFDSSPGRGTTVTIELPAAT